MIRKLLFAVLLLVAGGVGYGAVAHGYIINSPNRNPWYGYFANGLDQWGTQVLPQIYDGNVNAIPNYIGDGVGDDAQELIDFMNSMRNDPSNQRETGSAFIIATMMPGGGTVRTSNAAFSDWAQAIHYNADQGAITWHYSYTYAINTYYQGAGSGNNYDDDAFFCVGVDVGGGSCSGTNTSDVILFNMGGRIYALRRQCANPVMNGGLTSINVSPGWWITPHTVPVEATAKVGDVVHFKHYLLNHGPASDYPNYVWWDANDGVSGAATIAGNPYPGGIIPGGQDALANTETVTVSAADLAAGKVCRTTGVQANSYWDPAYLREPGQGGCIPVTNSATTPYYSVMGGDVAAGPGFGSACTPSLSGIKGNNLGSGSGYYGAGTQLGAFALGQVTGFATDTTRNTATGTGSDSSGGSVTQPSGLAFANAGTTPTVWGTSFGKDATEDPADNPTFCVPDYYSAAASGPTTPLGTNTLTQAVMNGLTSGTTYTVSGDLTVSGNITVNSRITLLVSGNVAMDSGFTYGGYTYTSGTNSAAVVPRLQVIARNIFIGRTIVSTAGFYAAVPNGANTGIIGTCGSGPKYMTGNVADASPYAYQDGSSYYADCATPLVVYGALAAKTLKLGRTDGSLQTSGSVGDGAAEKIVYTPELWLGYMTGGSTSVQPFDAITSLPPIL
ncbi:MAG TPA: hypothetical protein VLF40_06130 [Candidatus Saccharimonadales bacterium]|nr:hypothetical protein [Candidatus Saccharimonadales bacterium]